jgi:transposase
MGNENESTGALFGDLPIPERTEEAPRGPGVARVMSAHREQVELRACDLDSLLSREHPARAVWAFVESLDLEPLYRRIRAVDGHAGRPAIDPKILVALWLYATSDGVGSARELDRLCESEDAYRWLCGGVGVNYHALADFRTGHAGWLDAMLTKSIAALVDRGAVKLELVSQDGLRIRARAKAGSFRRRQRLELLLAEARGQVLTLKRELAADPYASQRRKQAARERVIREREARVSEAMATMRELEALTPPEPSQDAEDRDDPPDPPGSGTGGGAPTPAKKKQRSPVLRVSTTDPDARVMKMADGGFRPAFNAQLVVDTQTQLITTVDVSNEGTDIRQLAPLHRRFLAQYGRAPGHWLADGGFVNLQAIDALDAAGTQPCLPLPRSRKPATDPHRRKRGDSEAVAGWRAFMGTDRARAMYRQRGASVECANAHLRRRGLVQLPTYGLAKARAVVLWHALAHNVMRLVSLGIPVTA